MAHHEEAAGDCRREDGRSRSRRSGRCPGSSKWTMPLGVAPIMRTEIAEPAAKGHPILHPEDGGTIRFPDAGIAHCGDAENGREPDDHSDDDRRTGVDNVIEVQRPTEDLRAPWWPSTTCPSAFVRTRSSASWGPTAPARRRRWSPSPVCGGPMPAPCGSSASIPAVTVAAFGQCVGVQLQQATPAGSTQGLGGARALRLVLRVACRLASTDRAVGSRREARRSLRQPLGRTAAAPVHRPGPGGRARGGHPRRADQRPRPAGPPGHVGTGPSRAGRGDDGRAGHPLHGRGRAPLRPPGDHRRGPHRGRRARPATSSRASSGTRGFASGPTGRSSASWTAVAGVSRVTSEDGEAVVHGQGPILARVVSRPRRARHPPRSTSAPSSPAWRTSSWPSPASGSRLTPRRRGGDR